MIKIFQRNAVNLGGIMKIKTWGIPESIFGQNFKYIFDSGL